jgi:hypothetical protein
MGSHLLLWASWVLLDVQYMISLYPVLGIQIRHSNSEWFKGVTKLEIILLRNEQIKYPFTNIV